MVNTQEVQANVLIPSSPFKGLNGINFDSAGDLYVGSFPEQKLYRVNINNGEFETFIDAPEGQGDDFFFSPSGEVFFTAFLSGEVRRFDPTTQTVNTIVSNLPGANPIIQKEDGRIFVAQTLTPFGNGLFELDPTQSPPLTLINNNPGFLNSFDFGPDGLLYSPLQLAEAVVKIDVDTGTVQPVAGGFSVVTSVKFNSSGELFALDNIEGDVVRVDPVTGAKEVVVSLPGGLDTMAFSSDDLLYVTNHVEGAIYEVNTDTGETRQILESGGLAFPLGIAAFDDKLYVADTYSYRVLDRETGVIENTALSRIQFPLNTSVNEDHILTSSWLSGRVQRLDRTTLSVLNDYEGFSLPYDAVELADGSILVADCLVDAGQVTPIFGQVTQILDVAGTQRDTVASDLLCPTGLAVVDENTVLVSESLGNRLSSIDLSTGAVDVIATGLLQPEGIAYHEDGIVVVAEVGTQSLKAINLNTGKIRTLATDLPIGLPNAPGTPIPYGMTGVTLIDDTVYLAGDADNSIRTFSLKPVPEHTSPLSLLAMGILGLGLSSKLQKKRLDNKLKLTSKRE
ncbi:MAG: PQQ-binding-like beta-propeller repeat protein [Crocosphaera sp.]|nr:PQQ-binding-like beta-propeller repeat protein [Crocosphaera sp.]